MNPGFCLMVCAHKKTSNYSNFGDPSGSFSNLHLEIPVDFVALRSA
jgi:hypothetical protein